MKKPFSRSNQISLPKKQTGAALLLFILLVVVSASTLLVSKLNKAATQYYRDDVTMKALLKAKEALIGYAVNYPEISSNDNMGPGYLPCPDTSPPGTTGKTGSGFPQSGCGGVGTTTSQNQKKPPILGRLPWRTLGLPDVRDSSGETLWYALSFDFRNSQFLQPLNSETVTHNTLSINNEDDIVAIIFAPKEPLDDVERLEGNSIVSSHYLEFLQDELSTGTFTSLENSNDIYLTLTKQELMRAIEKRAIGEVSKTLKNYFAESSTVPWLSPFSNPKTNSFIGISETRKGLLPLHIPDEEFSTSFTVEWDFTDSNNIATSPEDGKFETELQSNMKTVTSGICRWVEDDNDADKTIIQGYNTVECQGSLSENGVTYTFDLGFTDKIPFNGTFETSSDSSNSPTSRTRSVDITNLPKQTTPLIQISDATSTGTVVINDPTTGLLKVSGIKYKLNTNPSQEEIPHWFVKNNWHHLTYVAYRLGISPEIKTEDSSETIILSCDPETNCLTLVKNHPQPNNGIPTVISNKIQAVVISAGAELINQDRTGISHPVTEADYFEGENIPSTIPITPTTQPDDLLYERSPFPPDWNIFNDQVRVIYHKRKLSNHE